MLLRYLGKLKNQKFALCMHIKHVSSVTFYHLSNRYLPNVSAKINTMQNMNIVVWSDFRQDITDTAIDQCRKHLQACVRANGGYLNTFCEQILENNLHFSCVFGSSGFYLSCQIFTALMVNRPTLLNCKALSLLRTVNEQKVKCSYFAKC